MECHARTVAERTGQVNPVSNRNATLAAAREAGHAANDGDYAKVLRIMMAEKEANGGDLTMLFAQAYLRARKEG